MSLKLDPHCLSEEECLNMMRLMGLVRNLWQQGLGTNGILENSNQRCAESKQRAVRKINGKNVTRTECHHLHVEPVLPCLERWYQR